MPCGLAIDSLSAEMTDLQRFEDESLLSGGALLLVLTGQALAFSDDRTEQLLAEHQQAVLAYAAKAGKRCRRLRTIATA
jgi:hypothetical protein